MFDAAPPPPPPRGPARRPLPSPVPHRAALAATYAAASLSAAATLPPPASVSLLATVWGAYVGAISFTEAWTKFRAPTLDTAAAVDAGRHVFAALNACEVGLASGLVLALARGGAPRSVLCLAAPPLAALAADVAFLTPSLDARARHVIATSSLPGGRLERAAAVAAIKESVAGRDPPPAALHGAYVAGEAVKIAALAALVARTAAPLIAGSGDALV